MPTPIDLMLDAVEWTPIAGTRPPDADGLPVATHSGVLRVGDIDLRCYQLADGRRLFDADDIRRVFGLGGWPANEGDDVSDIREAARRDPVAYMMIGDMDKPFHRPECECADCEAWRRDHDRPTHAELRKAHPGGGPPAANP